MIHHGAPVGGVPVTLTPLKASAYTTDDGETVLTSYARREKRAHAVTDDAGRFVFHGVEP